MKIKFTILLAFICLSSVLAQVKENEILSKDINGKAKFIRFKETKISSNEIATVYFLKKQYDVDDKVAFLPINNSVYENKNFTSLKYQQYYNDVKVEFAKINVVSQNNNIHVIIGNYIKIGELSTIPSLSLNIAIEKAKNHIGAEKYMWENETNEEFIKQFTNDPKATYLPEGELVLIRENVLNESSKIVLAYKISIYAELPYSKNTVYVNADTGKIILSNPLLSHAEGTAQTRYSGAKTIETAEIGGSQFKLFDNTRGGGIRTYDMNGGTNYGAAISFIDNDNNWSEYNNSNKDNAALDAHWGAMMVYDYFLQEHGWDSYDGNGAVIKSYVHFNGNYDNAFGDPTMKIMSYGDGSIKFDALTSLDVVAHEIGHGINQLFFSACEL